MIPGYHDLLCRILLAAAIMSHVYFVAIRSIYDFRKITPPGVSWLCFLVGLYHLGASAGNTVCSNIGSWIRARVIICWEFWQYHGLALLDGWMDGWNGWLEGRMEVGDRHGGHS